MGWIVFEKGYKRLNKKNDEIVNDWCWGAWTHGSRIAEHQHTPREKWRTSTGLWRMSRTWWRDVGVDVEIASSRDGVDWLCVRRLTYFTRSGSGVTTMSLARHRALRYIFSISPTYVVRFEETLVKWSTQRPFVTITVSSFFCASSGRRVASPCCDDIIYTRFNNNARCASSWWRHSRWLANSYVHFSK